ncbi:autotransporter outer membrane beta-barrel domain-containing protein [Escherichia coli]|nr:autotransporter [Escherichia coli O91:H14 str. 2009C-3227]KYT03671.1 autotransporter outer membrane beta-barrel domain-containing protein [Escherichia coli]KYT58436.1 autotransporter outer membrane beta-barrel domain-containing protein [Escherichia coli]KYU96727.1 autotransporter outer membrane beta-barrel domain-containing protein [Escherichia coli]OWD72559.1 autotransporter outer membrane beta-barrel domain-containing protein [Escherichia coli]
MTASVALSVSLSALPAEASTVSAEIPYQTFRDFAENKGVFTPGATGIEIKDKNGNAVGTLDVPMIDFSSVSRRGSLTLLSQGYGVSAKHGGLGDVNNASFGYDKNNYTVVKNNKHSGLDFSLHRFSKLITEAAPADINISGQLSDSSQYTAFYRAGAGTQYIKERSGKQTHIPGTFLTGGTVGTPWYSGNNLISSSPGDTYNKSQGPLASYGQMGDSGSPLFAYDSLSEKWSLAGVTLHNNGVNGQKNNWLLLPEDYIKNIITADFDPIISFNKNSKEHMSWTYDAAKGVGRIQQDDQQFVMHGNLNGNLNAGKNLYFTGENGIIDLKDNVNQGAGYLQFADDYTVTTSNDSSWSGGGIIVNYGTTVKWGINGVSGDDLHKVGDGTLIINGTGKNEGGLKIGAGTVILEQKAKNNDSTAFSSINISGGNSRVKLSGDNQIIPDNVSWGFRGGYLDINGKNTEFSRLQAVDYGAAIINSSTDKSLLTLNLSPLKKDEIAVSVKALDMNAIFQGGHGTAGDLYKTTFYGPTQYYLLKKPKFGSVLMGSLKNTSEWQFAGTDLNQAVDMAKNNKLTSSAQASYLYHGKLLGNMDIVIPELTGNDILTLDGSVSISGDMSKQDGALIFQGHPVIHAGQTVSASQSDWENREFSLNNLNLNNADFSLSRNAFMNGNIRAVNQSTVIIGGDTVFTDKNDGTGNDVISVEGKSAAAGTSSYTGHITLEQKSALDIRDNFRGGVTSEDSHINVSSSSVLFSDASSFINSSLNIHKGGALTAQGGLFTSGSIDIGDASLLLTGTPVNSDDAAFLPTINMADGGFKLMSDSSVLKARDQASVVGDIISDKQATISFGTESGKEGILSEKASRGLAVGLLSGFNTAYRGAIHAPSASATVNNTWWQLTGDSSLRSLKNTGSMTYFTGSAANKAFHTLTVDELTTNGTAYAMRTDLKNADKLVVNKKLSGKDNILLVDFLNKPSGEKLDIELVSAPGNSSKDVFKGSEQAIGFSNVTPVITTRETDDKITWSLTGYNTVANKEATRNAAALFSVDYKAFLNEVNNLNKRMGDLRDINGEAGAWARIMSGTGSASGGFSDNYTHVQVGVDKKHELDGLDLFTGFTVTHTDSSASADVFSGKTKSVGAGLYASAMFDSGAYIDLIGKYVHHDNEYTATFAGLGTRDYSTHSWYAGAEAGYRYHVTEDAWIEPQAELVYGSVSGKQFAWKDQGMHLSMKDKDYNPLIGRTGVDVGKSFSGKDWKVTARAGLGYQFDLLANGETVLRDASGEKRIKGEKDSRMLMSVGLNAEIRDNVRFGLEFEKSAFGKYNVDNAVNANFRYSF